MLLTRLMLAITIPHFNRSRAGEMVALCLSAVLAMPAFALAPEEQTFINSYRDAVNSKSIEKLKTLIHPDSLACMNTSNQDYFDETLGKEVADTLPADTKFTFSLDIQPYLLQGYEFFKIPTKPDRQIQLDYNKSKFSSVTRIMPLLKQGDKLFKVTPCLTEAGLVKFREAQRTKKVHAGKTRAAFNALPTAVKTELMAQLKAGRKIDAIKTYRAKTSSELTEAVEIIDMLQREMGIQ